MRLPRAGLSLVAQVNRLASKIDHRARILQPHKVADIYWPDWVTHGNRLQEVSDWQPAFDIWRGFRDAAKWYIQARMV